MSRKKTAAELAEDVKRLEERLAKAREAEKRQSKVEEARTNADIISAVKEYWAALAPLDRPLWDDMPEYIRRHIPMISLTEEISESSHTYSYDDSESTDSVSSYPYL